MALISMKNIVFIGAGGFACECYAYLQDILAQGNDLIFKGFLSTTNNLHPYGLEKYFLGHYDDYNFDDNDYVVIAIGACGTRKALYDKLKAKNVKFFNLISPKAYIPNISIIPECTIVAPFVSIAMNAKIGIGNIINGFSGIGHDAMIGNFNVFSSHIDICGFTKIGDENFFGSRVSTLPRSKIGNNNKIAAGSVVYRGCKNNRVMQGNPAVVISTVEDLS